MSQKKFIMIFLTILLAGSLLRLALAANFYGTSDVGAWEQAARYSQEGRSPYDETYRYNYSPVWFWIISAVSRLAALVGAPFVFAVKWPLLAADLAIVWVLYKILSAGGADKRAILWVSAIYFLNPASILVSGYHGQFDNISLLFVLLACYFHQFQKDRGYRSSLLCFSFGVAIKHFNVLLIPIFAFAQKKKIRSVLMLAAPPALFLLLLVPYFLTSREYVIKNIFHHQLGSGYWGWLGVICRSVLFFTGEDITRAAWFRWMNYFNPTLYLAMAGASWFLAKKRDLFESITILFLMFYVFTTQIGPQYSLWVLPFAALRPRKEFYVYSFVLSLQLAVFFYCHHHWYQQIPFAEGLPSMASKAFVILRYSTWAVCVWWLAALAGELRAGARR